jgi:hypothetical protein
MPLSEKTKNRLLMPFAISRIMRFGALPGLIGFALIGFGFYLQIDALIIVGFVLAIPILWVYFVIMCICFPYLLVDSLWKTLKNVK